MNDDRGVSILRYSDRRKGDIERRKDDDIGNSVYEASEAGQGRC